MIEDLTQLVAGGGLIALPIALVAGVVAGLNPCCLPIYPAAAGCCTAFRRDTLRGNLWIAAAFVVGGCVTTTALGIVSGLAGRVLAGLGSWPVYAIAAVPLVLGLDVLGVLRLPLPRMTTDAPRSPRGSLGAFATGVLLGLVITPCATPVLAGLLAYVANTRDPVWGGLLLFVYGIGLGVPVLLLGTTAASLVTRLSSHRARRWADWLAGGSLIGVGLYLVWIA
jgi:cytochrome c-type biogenesis protein